MNVSRQQLEKLLELNGIDQAIVTQRHQLNSILNDQQVTDLQQQLNVAGVALLEASKAEEVIDLELKRNNNDLEIVEQREKRDRERLQSSTNSKDVAGLQSELVTLAKRRSELEDASLELMEQLAQAQVASAQAKDVRESIRETQARVTSAIDAEALKMRSAIDLAQQERFRVIDLLSAELIAVYEKKRERGGAIGLLNGPECGACRMTISSAEYSALLAKPADEMVYCPECSAILVRP